MTRLNNLPLLRLSRTGISGHAVVAACVVVCALQLGTARAALQNADTASALRQDVVVEPALRLRAEADFNTANARVGDTVHYRLRVVWNDIPAGVMLNPREALDAPGFAPAGRAVAHLRSSENGQVVNQTTYTYALVPREAGIARVPPYSLRYLNGLTGREEDLAVPGTALTVKPAPTSVFESIRTRTGIVLGVMVVTLGFLGGAIWFWVRRRRGSELHRSAADSRTHSSSQLAATPSRRSTPESEGLKALRARCDAADSRVWMQDAERLCVAWLCAHLGITKTGNVRFEAALDQYLTRTPGLPSATVDGWTKLRDLFHESRYGGPRRQPHELHATCHTLRICLLLDDHNAAQPNSLKQVETSR